MARKKPHRSLLRLTPARQRSGDTQQDGQFGYNVVFERGMGAHPVGHYAAKLGHSAEHFRFSDERRRDVGFNWLCPTSVISGACHLHGAPPPINRKAVIG